MMAKHEAKIIWHDIRNDVDDLPSTEEPILITIEPPNGDRRLVWLDAYLHDSPDGPMFVTMQFDITNQSYGFSPVWYPVIAWAYPPDPYAY